MKSLKRRPPSSHHQPWLLGHFLTGGLYITLIQGLGIKREAPKSTINLEALNRRVAGQNSRKTQVQLMNASPQRLDDCINPHSDVIPTGHRKTHCHICWLLKLQISIFFQLREIDDGKIFWFFSFRFFVAYHENCLEDANYVFNCIVLKIWRNFLSRIAKLSLSFWCFCYLHVFCAILFDLDFFNNLAGWCLTRTICAKLVLVEWKMLLGGLNDVRRYYFCGSRNKTVCWKSIWASRKMCWSFCRTGEA